MYSPLGALVALDALTRHQELARAADADQVALDLVVAVLAVEEVADGDGERLPPSGLAVHDQVVLCHRVLAHPSEVVPVRVVDRQVVQDELSFHRADPLGRKRERKRRSSRLLARRRSRNRHLLVAREVGARQLCLHVPRCLCVVDDRDLLRDGLPRGAAEGQLDHVAGHTHHRLQLNHPHVQRRPQDHLSLVPPRPLRPQLHRELVRVPRRLPVLGRGARPGCARADKGELAGAREEAREVLDLVLDLALVAQQLVPLLASLLPQHVHDHRATLVDARVPGGEGDLFEDDSLHGVVELVRFRRVWQQRSDPQLVTDLPLLPVLDEDQA
eukprot:765470-Hanusia_phi.AAC.2